MILPVSFSCEVEPGSQLLLFTELSLRIRSVCQSQININRNTEGLVRKRTKAEAFSLGQTRFNRSMCCLKILFNPSISIGWEAFSPSFALAAGIDFFILPATSQAQDTFFKSQSWSVIFLHSSPSHYHCVSYCMAQFKRQKILWDCRVIFHRTFHKTARFYIYRSSPQSSSQCLFFDVRNF